MILAFKIKGDAANSYYGTEVVSALTELSTPILVMCDVIQVHFYVSQTNIKAASGYVIRPYGILSMQIEFYLNSYSNVDVQ